MTPGEYRPAVEAGNDWMKTRRLETVAVPSHVAYSRMDDEATQRLDAALSTADPERLGSMKTDEFVQALGGLYAELDYLHPFSDGNSRTLREFTRELAEAAGYSIEWERFGSTEAGRDVLYIARDRSVNELALPHIQNDGTRRDVMLSMDQFEDNRALPDLLRDVIRPGRAVAFEREPESDAIEAFPELAEAFKTLHSASEYFQAKIPDDKEAQAQALNAVRAHIQTALNHGETRDFRREPGAAGKTQARRQDRSHDSERSYQGPERSR